MKQKSFISRTAIALAAAVGLNISPDKASAEVYTLTAQELYDGLCVRLSDWPYDQINNRFTVNASGVEWQLDVTRDESVTDKTTNFGPELFETGYFSFMRYRDYQPRILKAEISLSIPSDETIVSVACNMGFYDPKIDQYDNIPYRMTCQYGETSESKDLTYSYYSPEDGYATQTFNIQDSAKGGRMNIYLESDTYGDFYFKELKVTTSALKAKTPTMELTLPVGHSLYLECDDSDADLHYSINSRADWQDYNPSTGISFSDAGQYTIYYYASADGMRDSEVGSKTVSVVAPSGINHAIRLNSPITVSGRIISQHAGYTLIHDGDTSAYATEDECLAIDNTRHAELAKAAIGSDVEATGRPTDRFTIAGLGSISNLQINGRQTTVIESSVIKQQSSSPMFDLQGRSARAQSQASTPRILVSSGRKILSR